MKIFYDFGGSDGSPGTNQDTSSLGPPNLRFKTADDATIDTNNPLPVPSSGTTYSYWKQVYLFCSTAPSTQIDNVKFYTDGSSNWGASVACYIGTAFPTKNSGSDAGYDVATGTGGTSGDPAWYGGSAHGDITYVADVFDYTSGSSLDVSISETSNIIDAASETTNYIVLQMEVLSSASAGDLANETFTFRYDEI